MHDEQHDELEQQAVDFFDSWRNYAGHGKAARQVERGRYWYDFLPVDHPYRTRFAFVYG